MFSRLARELGFKVRIVIDGDKPGSDTALLAELLTIAEMVVRLPDRTAIEQALVVGINDAAVLTALTKLNEDFSLGLSLAGQTAGELQRMAEKAIKSKNGLHRAWVERLPTGNAPKLATQVLDTVCGPVQAVIGVVQLAAS